MTKHLVKYRSLVAAIFMLAPLLFWFAYSEIGQFTVEIEHPATQDYCEIVKVTKAETGKAAVSALFKLKVEKQICLHCIDLTNERILSYIKLDLEHFHTPQSTINKIYLYNRTFLI